MSLFYLSVVENLYWGFVNFNISNCILNEEHFNFNFLIHNYSTYNDIFEKAEFSSIESTIYFEFYYYKLFTPYFYMHCYGQMNDRKLHTCNKISIIKQIVCYSSTFSVTNFYKHCYFFCMFDDCKKLFIHLYE